MFVTQYDWTILEQHVNDILIANHQLTILYTYLILVHVKLIVLEITVYNNSSFIYVVFTY